MMKSEFIEKAKIKDIPQEDYEIIEFVYTWHPIIDPVKGKQQIADIYNLPHGMRIIRDMLETARKAQEIDNKRMELIGQRDVINAKIEELNRQLDALAY